MGYFEPEKRSTDPSTGGWGSGESGREWFSVTNSVWVWWDGSYERTFATTIVSGQTNPPGSYDFQSGWEDSGGTDVTDGGLWTGSNANCTITGSPVHTDSYALECDNSTEFIYGTFPYTTDIYFKGHIRLNTLPVNNYDQVIIGKVSKGRGEYGAWYGLYKAGGTIMWRMGYRENNIEYYVNSTMQVNPSVDTWYHVELKVVANNSGAGEYRLYVEDSELTDITQTSLSTGDSLVSFNAVEIGQYWRSSGWTTTVYIDDVMYNPNYIGDTVVV